MILAEKLQKRILTGLNASNEIKKLFDKFNNEQLFWFEKILKKDISILNIGSRTFDEGFGLQTKFKIQLAEEQAEIENIDEDTVGDLQLKGNGIRTTVVIEDKKVGAIYGGRDGIIAQNFYFLTEELETLANDFIGQSYVLDGEVHINHDPHKSMTLYSTDMTKTEQDFIGKSGKVGAGWKKQQEKMAKFEEYKSQAKFMIFDIISLDHWLSRSCPITQELRGPAVQLMGKKAKELSLKYIEAVPTERVNGTVEAVDAAQKYIDKGFEGAVFKPLNGLYEFKRSRSWLKCKKVHSFECRITGFEIQKPKYNPNGTLKADMAGKVVCIDKNGDTHKIGTGKALSESIRIDMWENPESYLEKIIECSAQQPSAKSTKMINPRLDLIRFDRLSLED